MYTNGQFIQSLTEEQKTFLNGFYNDMMDAAYIALLKYDRLKTKRSRVEFMELAGRAFQMFLLTSDVEEDEFFITVFEAYSYMLSDLDKKEWNIKESE